MMYKRKPKNLALLSVLYVATMLVTHIHLASSLVIEKEANSQATNTLISEQVKKSSQKFDSRRPIWNLAHMVNSIKELDYRLG